MDYPYLVEPTPRTLEDIMEALEAPKQSLNVPTSNIAFGFNASTPSITFWDKARQRKTVPITSQATQAICELLAIPNAFFRRLNPDLRQQVATALLEKVDGRVVFTWGDEGIERIAEPGVELVESRQIVEAAMRVIDKQAKVINYQDIPGGLWLDVVVPSEDFGQAVVVGDKKVGDITMGGLRFMQIRDKRRLAPEVQEFFYRLVCTNGAECVDDGESVHVKGRTAEQQIEQLEEIAHKKFSRVTSTIEAFYDLRRKPIKDPDRWVNRLCKENGLSQKLTNNAIDIVPALIDEDPTMFDLANLFTHLANEPSIRRQSLPRRKLEKAGGRMVTEHAARCSHCQSRLLTA